MTETSAVRSRRGPATVETVEALHEDFAELWKEVGGVAERERLAFTLAVVEAAANVVVHATPSGPEDVELAVELSVTPIRMQAEVYEINAALAAVDLGGRRPMDALTESGRGLELIRTLVDTVVYERRDGTNVWVLCRTRAPEGG